VITKTDILKKWAAQWIQLKAWGRPLEEATFTFEPYKSGRLGCAWVTRRAIEIRETGSLQRDLATVIHELAHLAAPGSEHHGDKWRAVFCRGAHEALGVAISDTGGIHMLDRQVESACHTWLVHTGQFEFLKALGVIAAR
jgi:hypothetical protein